MCCRAIFCCGSGNTVSREVELADLRSNMSHQENIEESLGLLHGSQAGDDGTNIDPAGSEDNNIV